MQVSIRDGNCRIGGLSGPHLPQNPLEKLEAPHLLQWVFLEGASETPQK